MKFEFFVALSYLRGRQSGSLVRALVIIAFLVVFFSVSIPIWMISVVGGMHGDITEKLLARDAHIRVIKKGAGFREYREILAHIKESYGNDIVLAYPFFESTGLIRTKDRRTGSALGVKILALRQEDILRHPYIQKRFNRRFDVSGTQFKLADEGNLLLGNSLYDQLSPSDLMVELLIPFGSIADSQEFRPIRVQGSFSGGLKDIDSSMALISLDYLPSVFQTADVASGIGILVNESTTSPDELWGKLQHDAKLNLEFIIANSTEEGIYKDFKWQSFWIRTILLLLVAVAFVTVYVALQVLVLTKKQEIAILRAIGGSLNQVRQVFMFQGFLLGIIGGGLGVAMGLLLTESMGEVTGIAQWATQVFSCGSIWEPVQRCDAAKLLKDDVFYETRILTHVGFIDVFVQCLGAIIASTLAALIPAQNAIKIPPAMLLRVER